MKTGLLLPPFDLVEKWMYWSELWNELVSCGAKKEYKVLKHCSLHDSRTIGRGETLATKSAISCWTNPGPQKPAFPNTCQGLNVYCGSQANYSVVFVTQSGGLQQIHIPQVLYSYLQGPTDKTSESISTNKTTDTVRLCLALSIECLNLIKI